MFQLNNILKLISFGILLHISQNCFATNDIWARGARAWGISGASVALSPDAFALYNNPAALAQVRQYQIAGYADNRFGVPGVGVQGFAFNVPLKASGLGFGFQRNGLSTFTENRFGVGYGRSFGKFSIGIKLNYYQVQNIETASLINFDLAGLVQVSSKTFIGFHVYNPLKNSYGQDDRLFQNALFRLGVRTNVSEKVKLLSEAEQETNFPLAVKLGVEYQPIKSFFVRGGIATGNITQSIGMGYKLKGLNVDIAYTYVNQLGAIPRASIIYSFGKEK